jgi:hypothetical protein
LRGIPYTVLLFALAGWAIAQNQRVFAISPDKLVFPATPVHSQTAPLRITVTNTATVPVNMQEIIVSGIDFAQTNDCGKELAAGAKCSIQVVFKPATSGDRIGSLEVLATTSPQPDFVALTGMGTDQ